MTWDDPFLDALEPLLARYRDSRERRESLIVLRALRLAIDLETGEELLRTGRAPLSKLDPVWVKAYGLH